MENRLNLLCEAGVIDRDICDGVLRVVQRLENEWHLPVNSDQGTIAMTHMASALMRCRRGEEVAAMDDELLAEIRQSEHWPAILPIHQAVLQEFSVSVNPNEEGYLQANLYGLWMAANDG